MKNTKLMRQWPRMRNQPRSLPTQKMYGSGESKMSQRVEIAKVENGYIVTTLDFLGKTRIFTTFAEMTDFLLRHFDEEVKKREGGS